MRKILVSPAAYPDEFQGWTGADENMLLESADTIMPRGVQQLFISI